MNTLFDTKAKQEVAIANFKSLQTHAGWLLIKNMLGSDIEGLKTQILEGIEGATEDDMNKKRHALKVYTDLLAIPELWIERLQQPEPYVDENDPYHTPDSLNRSRQDTK